MNSLQLASLRVVGQLLATSRTSLNPAECIKQAESLLREVLAFEDTLTTSKERP
jgi:hypothetical protein